MSDPAGEQSELVEKVLIPLRRWTWEAAYRKLEVNLRPSASQGNASPELGAFFLAWLTAERGSYEEAEGQARQLADSPALLGWGLFLQAFAAFRKKEFAEAMQLLARAEEHEGPDDSFKAAIALLRGSIHYHRGQSDTALPLLTRAYELLHQTDKEHFGLGRVLDSIGSIYASRDNFHAARELYRRSLQLKERHDDQVGLALTHGQLGRLYQGWGLWSLARGHFEIDLRICERIDEHRGRVQMLNALGQLALTEGNAGEAGQWLDSAINAGQGKQGWEVLEGYVRKDRAMAFLAEQMTESTDKAEEQLARAEALFRGLSSPFAEGLAHVNLAWGSLYRQRGKWEASSQKLKESLRYFLNHDEPLEAARTQLELCRTRRAAGESRAPLSRALRDALVAAEDCRRVHLVREIESELRDVDVESYYRNILQRARGHDARADATDLVGGVHETISAMFLDIKGSTVFTREHDPAEVMLTMNQLMAALAGVLRKHEVRVCTFQGDGFFALARGESHAGRAVQAALDLNESMCRFNEPRQLLGLPLFSARVGISTGEAFLGNVGTYDKLDFTAIGRTVNLGARLEPAAMPGRPCISQTTRDLIGNRFTFAAPEGRQIEARNFDPPTVRVWDVTGRRS